MTQPLERFGGECGDAVGLAGIGGDPVGIAQTVQANACRGPNIAKANDRLRKIGGLNGVGIVCPKRHVERIGPIGRAGQGGEGFHTLPMPTLGGGFKSIAAAEPWRAVRHRV